MAELGDAFIALPGGYGTMEELLEIVTWQQLGYHKKPVGVLNINGFYDHLLKFFDQTVEQVFPLIKFQPHRHDLENSRPQVHADWGRTMPS